MLWTLFTNLLEKLSEEVLTAAFVGLLAGLQRQKEVLFAPFFWTRRALAWSPPRHFGQFLEGGIPGNSDTGSCISAVLQGQNLRARPPA